jgi:hypothetical protein
MYTLLQPKHDSSSLNVFGDGITNLLILDFIHHLLQAFKIPLKIAVF